MDTFCDLSVWPLDSFDSSLCDSKKVEARTTVMSREQFLAALDKEIEMVISQQSATGRNRWALVLTLSGLLWLGLQTLGAAKFSIQNVALLAIVLHFLWQFALKAAAGLDRSLIPAQEGGRGRFFEVSKLLGAVRSIVLFEAVKQATALMVIFWLGLPELELLKWYVVASFSLTLLVFPVTYMSVPPMPLVDIGLRVRGSTRAYSCAVIGARLAVSAFLLLVTYRHFGQFAIPDVQLAIIVAAFVYVATLLVQDQFPTIHLTALRAVRQNLAFCRVPLVDAREQAEILLLSGASLAKTYQRSIDTILNAAEQVRTSFSHIEELLPELNKLASQLSEPNKREEYDRRYSALRDLYHRAEARHEQLRGRVKELDENLKIAGLFSPSSVQETTPLIDKLKAAIQPLNEQKKNLHAALFPANLS